MFRSPFWPTWYMHHLYNFLAQKTSRLCAPLQPTGKRRGELVNAWGGTPIPPRFRHSLRDWEVGMDLGQHARVLWNRFCQCFAILGPDISKWNTRRCRDVFRIFEGVSIEFSKKMICEYNWMNLQRAYALVVFPFHFSPVPDQARNEIRFINMSWCHLAISATVWASRCWNWINLAGFLMEVIWGLRIHEHEVYQV